MATQLEHGISTDSGYKIQLHQTPIFGMEDWVPSFKIADDAGFDVRCSLTYKLHAGECRTIHTGLYADMEKGIRLDIRDKSGIASKFNCFVYAGVVDSGYRGEILVCLRNCSNRTRTFKCGDKIAQLVPVLVPNVNLISITKEEYDSLEKTERGDKGGITGVSATED